MGKYCSNWMVQNDLWPRWKEEADGKRWYDQVAKLKCLVLRLGMKSMRRYQKIEIQVATSIFLYPSQEVAHQKTMHKQLVFQWLRQCIVTGFNSNNNVALTLDKGHNNQGILVLNNDDINHIQRSMKQQLNHLLKFHTYLAYLFELGYDVAIQPSMNVPSNVGFKSSFECLADRCMLN